MIENHQLVTGWPPGHTGQTLLDLTAPDVPLPQRPDGGRTRPRRRGGPGRSNLKPVWFYQEGLAGGDVGRALRRRQPRHLVAGRSRRWRSSAWMAFKRRSLALTLIAIGFAAQWIPWARIDRAAFQYHYYTALPFVVLAPRLLRRRAVARRVARTPGRSPGSRRAVAIVAAGRAVAALAGRCARSSASNRSTRARRPARRSSRSSS